MIYDFENLFNAYKAGIKCKRYRPDVMAYTDKLEENMIELQNEFIWQTYTVGRYNIFYVYEPKKRMIMSLTFKDRVAQHAIYSQLNPYFEKQFISDSYACRVGRGTHKAVNRLHDWLKQTDRKPQRFYYLKLDIAKYFYRIDHEVTSSTCVSFGFLSDKSHKFNAFSISSFIEFRVSEFSYNKFIFFLVAVTYFISSSVFTE